MADLWIVVIVVVLAMTPLFAALRRRTRLSAEDEARELERTERRIAEIERDVRRP